MASTEEIARRHWDCLVVGTGMGGATAGYALAQAGRSVLFLEKGRFAALHPDTLRGAYPEPLFPDGTAPAARHAPILARSGRFFEEIRNGAHRFIPLIGCGTGGSSALYGMAMERFFPGDFEPRRHFPQARESSLPETWPIGYQDLEPWYDRAEALYGVRGGRDPLRPASPPLVPRPPLGPRNSELFAHFRQRGLHPYPLPVACDFLPGCECCQGFLCPRDCKRDAGRVCLEPALRQHGARLLDECEAVRLEADRHRVTGVVCHKGGKTFTLNADRIILAAGALSTPSLLLRSASELWPQGLANTSGQVGRNLMRHGVDLYLVFTKAGGDNRQKEIGLSDFYLADGHKLGTLQSFGSLPPASVLAATLAKEIKDSHPWLAPLFEWIRPLVRGALSALFERGILLAAIMEDLPYSENRIVAGPPPGIEYRLPPPDLERVGQFRKRVASALRPYRFLRLAQAEKNSMLAHVCGTCRFGDDPRTSVLDAYNRTHDLDNLFVLDASFFPSSGGTNPALTIAANALRVAEHMLRRE